MMTKATRIGAYNWLLEIVLLQKEDGKYLGFNFIYKLLNWPLLALSTNVQGEQRPSKALMKWNV
jgi:hypothetical protein